jgi:hypothetical protein
MNVESEKRERKVLNSVEATAKASYPLQTNEK